MGINKYTVYTEVDSADTTRDVSNITTTQLGIYNKEEAFKVAKKYIKRHFFKQTDISKADGYWWAMDTCSYPEVLFIKELLFYTKEEVVELCKKAHLSGQHVAHGVNDCYDFVEETNNWIEKNL